MKFISILILSHNDSECYTVVESLIPLLVFWYIAIKVLNDAWRGTSVYFLKA